MKPIFKRCYLQIKNIVLAPIKIWGEVKSFCDEKFFKKYFGKKTINLAASMKWGFSLFLILMTGLSLFMSPEEDSSSYSTSYIKAKSKESEGVDGVKIVTPIRPLKGTSSRKQNRISGDESAPRQLKRGAHSAIKYAGKQVLVRSSSQGDRALPVGTNLIGKLLSSVDTRQSEKFVRVLLPYGGKFKNRVGIPKNTVLLGQVSYPSRGKRVYLNFHTGVLPNGEEIKVAGAAMDAKDFSPGLIGNYNSAFSGRAGATLGFSFVAGASEVLQEKEALGQGHFVSKKATLNNALLNGVSEFAKTEGAFQLEEARSETGFVTLNQGKELIITLTKTFKNGGEN